MRSLSVGGEDAGSSSAAPPLSAALFSSAPEEIHAVIKGRIRGAPIKRGGGALPAGIAETGPWLGGNGTASASEDVPVAGFGLSPAPLAAALETTGGAGVGRLALCTFAEMDCKMALKSSGAPPGAAAAAAAAAPPPSAAPGNGLPSPPVALKSGAGGAPLARPAGVAEPPSLHRPSDKVYHY